MFSVRITVKAAINAENEGQARAMLKSRLRGCGVGRFSA
jgi:hypothetical protein